MDVRGKSDPKTYSLGCFFVPDSELLQRTARDEWAGGIVFCIVEGFGIRNRYFIFRGSLACSGMVHNQALSGNEIWHLQAESWEKVNREVSQSAGFPIFPGQFLILSRTLFKKRIAIVFFFLRFKDFPQGQGLLAFKKVWRFAFAFLSPLSAKSLEHTLKIKF